MNSETDFVARGASFKSLAHKIVDFSVPVTEILPKGNIDTLSLDYILLFLPVRLLISLSIVHLIYTPYLSLTHLTIEKVTS